MPHRTFASMVPDKLPCQALQVIGAGVAGAGIMVAADRLGVADNLLAGGLVFLERMPRGPLQSLSYDIESNSPGAEFVSEIAPHGIFGPLLKEPRARALAAARERSVPLRQVSHFVGCLLDTFEAHARRRFGVSPIRYSTDVQQLMILPDGSFVSMDHRGRPIVRSRGAVFATGGEQVLDKRTWPRTTSGDVPPVVGSDEFLRGQRDDDCLRAVASGKRIMILGGSHSGWSVIQRILRISGHPLEPNRLILSDRRPSVLYFPSVQDADSTPRVHQICPESGQVNRFDGLRGAAQQLYRRYAAGQLPALERLGPPNQRGQMDGLALLIAATGYHPRRIDLCDHRGIPVATDAEFGNLKLNSRGTVVCRGRGPIPNLFGLGLGHAMRRHGAYRVGVNIFHGEAAGRILQEFCLGSRTSAPHAA